MNTHPAGITGYARGSIAGALAAAALVVCADAQAFSRCDAPQTVLDRRACEAARQGPTALRRTIQRLQSIESLYFYDYMSEAQLLAWREAEERGRATPAGREQAAAR